MKPDFELGTWTDCYDGSWKSLIVEAAFAHPAKYSRNLIGKIYAHAAELGWIGPGAVVLDPFGGVALGALDAMFHGCHWVGCELEPRFHDLGNQNIAAWVSRFGHTQGWGRATLLQGDSRKLCEVVGRQAGLIVSSPPYADSVNSPQDESKCIDRLRAAGYDDAFIRAHVTNPASQLAVDQKYGTTPGQLGAMKEGGADAVIGSPPFSGTEQPCASQSRAKKDYHAFTRGNGTKRDAAMTAPGQLGSLPEGSHADACQGMNDARSQEARRRHGDNLQVQTGVSDSEAAKAAQEQISDIRRRASLILSSPPYLPESDRTRKHEGKANDNAIAGFRGHYSDDPRNLGNPCGVNIADTFWAASKIIVSQCFALLKPGGHAIWVTKRFVRKGAIVDFSQQWARLCEAIGFRVVCWHRAMLVKDLGEHQDLYGGTERKTKERKSFFRRLAEKKGSPKIDWEDVICMVKPITAAAPTEATLFDDRP